ncbi:MFS transporter [Thermoactinospora rubra]|uniref:MFS transporter n=1 Tax=Thermoactinospora rubra TaxID=1088767 RepID=UPI000A0F88AC|nr:MFS transporter [Thermoactinospora rubra]
MLRPTARKTPASRRDGFGLVASLAVTQTIGFGVLYYAFSVFLTPMARELGTGIAQLTGAMTVSLLLSGLVAPFAGRWLDARGGRTVMTVGALVATAAVLAWSQVRSPLELYLVFAVLGPAAALVLYDAAFAVIVAWFDASRRSRALLAVTIVAGFASSVFLPLTGFLVERYGWRTALVILAIGYGVVAVPLHACLPRSRRVRPAGASVGSAVRERPFWLLAAAFLAQSGAVAVIAMLLVSYLIALGHAPLFAASAAGLLGVLSVTGRVVTSGLHSRWPVALVTAAVFVLQGVAAAMLPFVGATVPGAIGSVVLFGLGFGVSTIARPALLADRYGTAAYASISGVLTLPITFAKALAPLAGAAMAQAAGYTLVMAVVAAACLSGAVALAVFERVS